MSAPLVSVVLPVRNGGRLLAVAVSSMLDQTVRDLEVIIIDDHSTDGATGHLGCADPRLRIVKNEGKGLVDALNTGLRTAKAPWIARMDADDVAHPQRLASQLALAGARPELGIIGARVRLFTDSGSIEGGYRAYEQWINSLTEPDDIRREIYIESPIPHPTALIRQDVIRRIGLYRDGNFPEDYELWLRANEHGIAMAKPNEVLLDWRDYPERTSRTDPRYRPAQFLDLKADYLSRDSRLADGVMLWGAGTGGRSLHDALIARGVRVQGFIDVHPRRIGGHVRNLPVIGIDAIASVESFILVAVGTRGVKPEIREALYNADKCEEQDFLFAM